MGKPKSVLLIDDDEDDRWLFAEALARTVPSVVCTSVPSGQEAIQLLTHEANPLPDLIFLDLNMPGMDGKRSLSGIKEIRRARHVPIVVYSTSSYPKDVDETKALGATEFINKPSDYTELCLLLKKIFDEKFLMLAGLFLLA